MNKCETCKYFTGAGDFDLCCMKSMRRLCYGGEEACEAWKEAEIKHRYWIVRDNEVIALFNDHKGLHPVNVIGIMAKELSDRMQKEVGEEE